MLGLATLSLNTQTLRNRHSHRDIYMGKETGAKTETYMCMRRGTCSDRHLWKQTHAAEAVHTDAHRDTRRDMQSQIHVC